MNALFAKLLNDEAGYIVSAELVLIATVGVLALMVGLSEVAWNINNELQDVGRAFGAMNQSFQMQGQGGTGNSSFNNTNNGQHHNQRTRRRFLRDFAHNSQYAGNRHTGYELDSGQRHVQYRRGSGNGLQC